MSSISDQNMEPNQQDNSYNTTVSPMKRKRGRPRKNGRQDEVCRFEPNKRRKQCTVLQSSSFEDGLVGREVFCSFIGVFDAGYLLNVRVGGSGPILTGLVFDPRLCIPVSAENDIAPHLPMLGRNVFYPLVKEGFINQGDDSSRDGSEQNGLRRHIRPKESPTTSSFTSHEQTDQQLNMTEGTPGSLYLKLIVAPTPPRSKRVLWDQFHNIKYPPGYIPRDSLDVRNDILDWHGDHLHTNFHIMFNMLRDNGYFVEILGSPFTCFDASHYGTLLMVDLEDEYFREEIEKLRDDVVNGGLGLAVFSEWYNVDSMVKMRFFDDNTRSWWTPVTGGANIPALNELLAPFGIAFGDKILSGDYFINGEQSNYASGTDIVKFPGGGYVHSFEFQDNSETRGKQNSGMTKESSILGLAEIGAGRVVVYGDSNCLDSSHMVANCFWLLRKIMDFTNRNVKDPVLFSDSSRISFPMHEDNSRLPSRRTDVNFSTYSRVVGRELMCYQDSRFEVWGTKGYGVQLMGRNRKLPGYQTLLLDEDLNITKKATGSNKFRYNKLEENSSASVVRKGFSKSIDFLGLLNRDEVDIPILVATQWMIPVFVAMTCLVAYLSWRMRQKRRRRRKGSTSGRSLNLS